MKNAELSYHKEFPKSPVSGWAGAKWSGFKNHKNANGQWKAPLRVRHPFLDQRKLWCLLCVHFQGIDLIFAMPPEVDHFIKILSQNPLPSGPQLLEGQKKGRPNNHWLSRLPKEAKPWAFRQKLCKYLETEPIVAEFREFYAANPIRFKFDGYFDSSSDAKQARENKPALVEALKAVID